MEPLQLPPSSSFSYLTHRLWYRVRIFFHHWYVDGSYFFGRLWMTIFLSLERTFALRITLTHFFEPLYQDYSIVGQIIGPIFRLGRVVTAGLLYSILGIFFLSLYLFWLAIPVVLLLQAFIAFLSRP